VRERYKNAVKHPEFTWWPWGLLSLATPLVAIGAALGYYNSPHSDHDLVMAVLLSALGAGNAYVIAIAGGSLRAAMLAVPVGALTGFFTVISLQFKPFYLLYLFIMLFLAAGYTIESFLRYGCNPIELLAITVSFGISTLICMGMAASGFPATSPWAIVLAYPFVISCIVTAMVVRTRFNGGVEGFFAGFKSSLTGLLKGVFMSAPLCVITYFIASLLPGRAMETGYGLIAMGAVALAACNFYTLHAMFPMLLRVSGLKPPEAERERKLDRPAETLDVTVDVSPAMPIKE
jgi:hypothetical protein